MGSKRPMEPKCLTDLSQIGVIGVNVSMGVCSLLMAHHRRETDHQRLWTSKSGLQFPLSHVNTTVPFNNIIFPFWHNTSSFLQLNVSAFPNTYADSVP